MATPWTHTITKISSQLKLTYGKQHKFGVVKLHNYQFGIIKFGKLYLKYKQTLGLG